MRRPLLVSFMAVVSACAGDEDDSNGASKSPTETNVAGDGGTSSPNAGDPAKPGPSQPTEPEEPVVPRDPLQPFGCITDVTAGDHVFTCDGATFEVRLPASCVTGGCPVVLDVHGLSMNALMENANTNLRAIGEREGFVVVQPNAKGTAPATTWTSADPEKVWTALTAVRKAYRVDPKRVHVTGFSQGGGMTWTLLCKHSDEIASAAPAALDGCSATELAAVKREVPVLYMHGQNDAIVSYSVAVLQRNAVVSSWAMPTPTIVTTDPKHTRSRYVNAKGTVFEFLEHTYEAPSAVVRGHCFPGSTDKGGAKGQLFAFGCKSPNAFVWGEEVISFFKAHRLP